ncbi:hypothetical protein PUNSTDRAFT_144462 [Punctularia strigosozonata HHB-11173 SS5]|uniref:uncharacterized protein n=1 Tax=Punctularia strigosozonata (strain HHB-11173) TaxID=741275 RepID=UPI0004417095|nr:uncharacterized protein PUNSTDRAFT_144462 [Punctularia strigosozonata HHB-11173 SS5]EIN07998.1 hypothetical protein PUNSTDRAFT_144462 [Punctularia strigosozonata HHB-11173 SS5]
MALLFDKSSKASEEQQYQEPQHALVRGISSQALNAAVDLRLGGLYSDPVRITNLARKRVPLDYYEVKPGVYPNPAGAPPRPPSRSPPSEGLCIELSLDGAVAKGRCGIVYRVNVHRVLSADGKELSDISLPPLVAKVAGMRYTPHITREAWFYDELEALQGSVIPRCFGLFEAVLQEDTVLVPWKAHGIDRGKQEYYPDAELDSTDPQDPEAPRSDGEHVVHSRRDPRVPSPVTVSLLLFEELDSTELPLGGEMNKDLQAEIVDMFAELDRFLVEHNDVAHRNILRAPQSPTAYPSLPSPYTGRTYSWRIIDFNDSCKFNDDPRVCAMVNREMAEFLVKALAQGWYP